MSSRRERVNKKEKKLDKVLAALAAKRQGQDYDDDKSDYDGSSSDLSGSEDEGYGRAGSDDDNDDLDDFVVDDGAGYVDDDDEELSGQRLAALRAAQQGKQRNARSMLQGRSEALHPQQRLAKGFLGTQKLGSSIRTSESLDNEEQDFEGGAEEMLESLMQMIDDDGALKNESARNPGPARKSQLKNVALFGNRDLVSAAVQEETEASLQQQEAEKRRKAQEQAKRELAAAREALKRAKAAAAAAAAGATSASASAEEAHQETGLEDDAAELLDEAALGELEQALGSETTEQADDGMTAGPTGSPEGESKSPDAALSLLDMDIDWTSVGGLDAKAPAKPAGPSVLQTKSSSLPYAHTAVKQQQQATATAQRTNPYTAQRQPIRPNPSDFLGPASNVAAYSTAPSKSLDPASTRIGKDLIVYWYEVYESFGAENGNVYMLGRALNRASLAKLAGSRPEKLDPAILQTQSVCITFRNVKRNLYILPRKYALSDPADPTSVTDKEVAFTDVTKEIRELLGAEGIREIEMRKQTMKYCFDRFEPIPLTDDSAKLGETRRAAHSTSRKQTKKVRLTEDDEEEEENDDEDEGPEAQANETEEEKKQRQLRLASLLDPDNLIPDEADYLHLRYSYAKPVLRQTQGKTFSHVFGTHSSRTEAFLLAFGLRGPGWISIKSPIDVNEVGRNGWCALEFEVDLQTAGSDAVKTFVPWSHDVPPATCAPEAKIVGADTIWTPELPAPYFRVTSLSIKTMISDQSSHHELMLVSLRTHHGVNIETKTSNEADTELSTFVRLPTNQAWTNSWLAPLIQRRGNRMNVQALDSEKALMDALMRELELIDPDILVGHDLHDWVTEQLIETAKRCSMGSAWSKLGRLRMTHIPRLPDKGRKLVDYGVGAGRLLVDTRVAAMEFQSGSKDYTLGFLAEQLLGVRRAEVEAHHLPGFYKSPERLGELIDINAADTMLQLALMFKLEVVPLTRQLTELCGNRWQRSLRSARAERVEYLLLNEFSRNGYIVPEKRRKYALVSEDEIDEGSRGKRRKADYTGGMVLTPEVGFYDKWILLLDFNSLYPSIIREFNLCFSTTKHWGTLPKDLMALVPHKDESTRQGLLPNVVKRLIDRRRAVQSVLKTAAPEDKPLLHIKQLAFKLVANSMYGCLGFRASRFYCKPIAALITHLGQTQLLRAKSIVEKMYAKVIYGDTDSLMINTNTDSFQAAKKLSQELIEAVNKGREVLRIGEDGLFKSLLLVGKKRYAALKLTQVIHLPKYITIPPPEPGLVHSVEDGDEFRTVFIFKREVKGLDMVRRDWAPISRKASEKVLDILLSNGKDSREDVVNKIHEYLATLAAEMDAKRIPLDEYIMTKQLTRNLSEYANTKDLPHVQVAMRMRERKQVVSMGQIIKYVVTEGPSPSTALAARCVTPEEIGQKDPNKPDHVYKLDIDYYKGEQILPPLVRLCSAISDLSTSSLAHALGLKDAKYHRSETSSSSASSGSYWAKSMVEDKFERFKNQPALTIICPECKASYHFPGVFHFRPAASIVQDIKDAIHSKRDISRSSHDLLLKKDFVARVRDALGERHGFVCPTQGCFAPSKASAIREMTASLANQVTVILREKIIEYYMGVYVGDNNTHTIDFLTWDFLANPPKKLVTDDEIYELMSYFAWLFDVDDAFEVARRDSEWLEKNHPDDLTKEFAKAKNIALPWDFAPITSRPSELVTSAFRMLGDHVRRIMEKDKFHFFSFTL